MLLLLIRQAPFPVLPSVAATLALFHVVAVFVARSFALLAFYPVPPTYVHHS